MTGLVRNLGKKHFPTLYFLAKYHRAASKVASRKGERDKLFRQFLQLCDGKPCLQIAVKNEFGRKFGPNWVSVDKYDTSDVIDRHDDLEALQFADNSFEGAVCWSVLEHVPHPDKAIQELHRVLKPGGVVWVQLPFLFPYHESPKDYWRVTPDGLKMWTRDFQPIACACDYWAGSKVVAATYFFGRK